MNSMNTWVMAQATQLEPGQNIVLSRVGNGWIAREVDMSGGPYVVPPHFPVHVAASILDLCGVVQKWATVQLPLPQALLPGMKGDDDSESTFVATMGQAVQALDRAMNALEGRLDVVNGHAHFCCSEARRSLENAIETHRLQWRIGDKAA